MSIVLFGFFDWLGFGRKKDLGDEYVDDEESLYDDEWGDEEEKICETDSGEMMGELSIDLIDNEDTYTLRACVPGIDPEEIDVSLTAEMVSISAKRVQEHTYSESDFIYRELNEGSFSRSLMLPFEIDVEAAKAEIKDGLLTIELPKINKKKTKKVSIKKNS